MVLRNTQQRQLNDRSLKMTNATLPVIKSATLSEAIANVVGASFIGVDTITEVKLTGGKKNPFSGRVTKASNGNSVQVFTNKNSNAYENMVKRRLEKEGKNPDDFKLGERTWGTRIPNTPMVEHNGELYLEVIFLKAGDSTLLLDGLPYTGDVKDITGYPVEKESTGQGGLEDKVVIRTFKAASIKRLRIDHLEYVFA
jgi:hypothetical protein